MSAATGYGNPKSIGNYSTGTLNKLNPQQIDLFNRLLGGSSAGVGGGLDFLSKLASGDQSQFESLEAPAMRQFNQLQSQLASRFSGMGTGARSSSGFQNASSGAAVDLAERLQSQRLGLQQDAISQLLGLSESLLGTETQENFLAPRKRSFLQELLLGASPGFASSAGQGGVLALLKALKGF